MQRDPDFDRMAADGIHLPFVLDWVKDEWKGNFDLAMDAQPSLITTPNSGIPAWLTTIIDPTIITVLYAPNKAAKIFGEVRKGSWVDQTALFPIVEYTGEVSSYGDHSTNGRTGLNTDFPNRQAYLYQTIKEYGELEMERAGRARIGWAAEIDKAAVVNLNKFQNLTYFFGVAGLLNFGLVNDPALSASLTPAAKAAGGVTWFTAGGAPNATANEVYNDIIATFEQLVIQAGGQIDIDMENPMKLAMSPALSVALTFTNTFNVNVRDLLRKNFPRLEVETAVQYGKTSASNPQGIAGGNLIQLIAENVGGQDTGYCAFNEKLRTHPIIRDLSSFKQKETQGSWGAIWRQPFAAASMIGC